MILDQHGKPLSDPSTQEKCDHGVTFDAEEARKLLEDWQPDSPVAFIMGQPGAREVRKRFPRLEGNCPKGCGYSGIAYASAEHYAAGDW
jgi:hypothetical protein